MRPVIKYISFYDFADSGIARNYSVAAANKMDYIIESLVRIGYDVEVVSASACIESGTFRWYKSRVEERQPHVKTRFFSSFRCRSKILVLLRLIWGGKHPQTQRRRTTPISRDSTAPERERTPPQK